MSNYIIQETIGKTNTAGTKAKQDIFDILSSEAFETVKIKASKSKLEKFTYKFRNAKSDVAMISGGNVFFQYPMNSTVILNSLLSEIKMKNHTNSVAIIHDLRSLRTATISEQKEIAILNQFDCLIVHNSSMKRWLVGAGVVKPQVTLDIFDYLNPITEVKRHIKNRISFAGNLEKSVFLKKMSGDLQVQVLGPNPANDYPENVIYEGQVDPDILGGRLDGKYGLVWDGTSILTCDGPNGEYMKYNNPHKLSLYLSSGLPVIVWSDSAIAKFVRNEHVGIAVNSLKHIDTQIKEITDDEYQQIMHNVSVMSKRLRSGYYTKQAVKAAIRIVEKFN